MYNSFWSTGGKGDHTGEVTLASAALVEATLRWWRCWGSCAGDGDTGAATFRWLMVLRWWAALYGNRYAGGRKASCDGWYSNHTQNHYHRGYYLAPVFIHLHLTLIVHTQNNLYRRLRCTYTHTQLSAELHVLDVWLIVALFFWRYDHRLSSILTVVVTPFYRTDKGICWVGDHIIRQTFYYGEGCSFCAVNKCCNSCNAVTLNFAKPVKICFSPRIYRLFMFFSKVDQKTCYIVTALFYKGFHRYKDCYRTLQNAEVDLNL